MGSSNSRSSRPSTSTSTALSSSRPRSSSDGRSGTGCSGATTSSKGQVAAHGTHARQSPWRATSRSPGASAPSAAIGVAPLELDQGPRRHRVVAVDLAVGMGDGGADLGAAVLEHEHVVDVVAGAERRGALGPQVDHLAGAGDAERGEGGVVVGRVEHDLGPVAVERRPPVGEPAHVVGLGRLESRRGRTGSRPIGQVRPALAAGDDVGHVAGERIDPVGRRHGRHRAVTVSVLVTGDDRPVTGHRSRPSS